MNFYGNNYNPYNHQPYQIPNVAYNGNFTPQMAQPQMETNKIYVTSLEDALNRFAKPNSVMVYRNQDEKTEYEIMTDVQGKKSYKTFTLADYSAIQTENSSQMNMVSVDDFNRLESRVKGLEQEITEKYKKENKKVIKDD